jgi:hypothetical protein
MNRQIGLSPKLYPAIIAIVTGLLLIATMRDDDLGAGILTTGIGALGLGFAIPPGDVVHRRRRDGQAGYGLIELVIGVLLVLILLFVLVRVAR